MKEESCHTMRPPSYTQQLDIHFMSSAPMLGVAYLPERHPALGEPPWNPVEPQGRFCCWGALQRGGEQPGQAQLPGAAAQ